MADEEHLAMLKQGVDAWNQRRKDSPGVVQDLSGAILLDTDLSGVDLHGADLRLATLLGANLSNANLREANLVETKLSGANLFGADLIAANLSEANLSQAQLHWANLWFADLSKADLSGANLTWASLLRTRVVNADFTESKLGSTSFANVDLSEASGLEFVVHQDPSSIGVDTLALTLRGSGGRFTAEQLVFFEGAGVPKTLLEYLPSILESNPIQFFTCFISYSTEDEAFADRLNQDLNEASIKTWKWDRDAVRGRDLHQSIDRAICQFDKTILICSISSLTSPQVEPEIVAALDKETRIKANNAARRREALAAGEQPPQVDADVLIPIRLDDTIFNWDSHLKTEVSRRMISDFTHAPPDSEKYQDELQKLIHALNPQAWPPQVPSANASV